MYQMLHSAFLELLEFCVISNDKFASFSRSCFGRKRVEPAHNKKAWFAIAGPLSTKEDAVVSAKLTGSVYGSVVSRDEIAVV